MSRPTITQVGAALSERSSSNLQAICKGARIVDAYGGPERAPWGVVAALHAAAFMYVQNRSSEVRAEVRG